MLGGMDDERKPTGSRPLSRIIKSDAAGEGALLDKPLLRPPPRANVVNAEEFEARQTAKQIVEEAHQRAKEIVEAAHADRERIFDEARQEARAVVRSEFSEELARAKMQAGQILKDSERDVLELALKVAEKIVGRDLERDPALLLEMCATATEAARQAKAMVLRVNPQDGKLLRERRPKLMELIGRQLDLAIRDDSDVEPGGCIIQTEFGTIDAQLKTQFEMLRNVLTPDTAKKEHT